MDSFNPDHSIKTDKNVKCFQNHLPFFSEIYSASAMKMHQMAAKIKGIVSGMLTEIKLPKCNENVIGGIRKIDVTEFTKCINTTPRQSEF